jgi:hypothetical protein
MRGWFAVALLAALAIAPAALAQQGQFPSELSLTIVEVPASPLVIQGEPQAIRVGWVYQFANDAAAASAAAAQGSITMGWDPPACEGGGLQVTGSLTQSIPVTAGTSLYKGVAEFLVRATTEAPGEMDIACTFAARVDAASPIVPATPATQVQAKVRVAYFGMISAQVPITVQEAGPQKLITFEVDVRNLGNARTTVQFHAESGAGWQVIEPVPVVLDSMTRGASKVSQTVQLLVATPYKEGWNNGETVIDLVLRPSSTVDPAIQGDEVKLRLLARVHGWYCSTAQSCADVARELRANCPAGQEAECQRSLDTLQETARSCGDSCPELRAALDSESSPAAAAFLPLLFALALARRRRTT